MILTEKKIMKHDDVGTQNSKGKNEYFVIKMCFRRVLERCETSGNDG